MTEGELGPLAIIAKEDAVEMLAFLEQELHALAKAPSARIWLEFSSGALKINPGMVAWLAARLREHIASVERFDRQEAEMAAWAKRWEGALYRKPIHPIMDTIGPGLGGNVILCEDPRYADAKASGQWYTEAEGIAYHGGPHKRRKWTAS